MREIEIKAWVRDEKTLLALLREKGVILSKPLQQRDQVFGLPGAVPKKHFPWLRLRTQDDTTYIFTFKRSVTSSLDSIEHETEVSNPEELLAIIKEIGFIPFSDITKIRRKGKVGKIELCFDKINGLGTFIEAEKLCPHDEDAAQVMQELWMVLESFGVSHADEELTAYDILCQQKGLLPST